MRAQRKISRLQDGRDCDARKKNKTGTLATPPPRAKKNGDARHEPEQGNADAVHGSAGAGTQARFSSPHGQETGQLSLVSDAEVNRSSYIMRTVVQESRNGTFPQSNRYRRDPVNPKLYTLNDSVGICILAARCWRCW